MSWAGFPGSAVSAPHQFPSMPFASGFAALQSPACSFQSKILRRSLKHVLYLMCYFGFQYWVIVFCFVLDPPPPDGSPNITSVSHNSVKVKFSGFEASHGPIKAYAVILTTGEGKERPPWVKQHVSDAVTRAFSVPTEAHE